MQLIPAIDLMGGNVVRLVQGDPKAATIYSEDPLAVARLWAAAGADAIHIVDLDATLGIHQGSQLDIVLRIVGGVDVPVQVGGGLRTADQINNALSAGVHKVVLGTVAFKDPAALEDALGKWGAERIMVALDYGEGKVRIKGWQEATSMGPLKAVERFRATGARQFLMTSIARDGMLSGPDFRVLRAAAAIPETEIYASGGISAQRDVERLRLIGVKGFIVGKALYQGTVTMSQLRLAILGKK